MVADGRNRHPDVAILETAIGRIMPASSAPPLGVVGFGPFDVVQVPARSGQVRQAPVPARPPPVPPPLDEHQGAGVHRHLADVGQAVPMRS